jgi:hypothetical protein
VSEKFAQWMERDEGDLDPGSTGEQVENHSPEESGSRLDKSGQHLPGNHPPLHSTDSTSSCNTEAGQGELGPDAKDLEIFVGVDDEEKLNLPPYRDYVVGSPAYGLLLSRIKRNMMMATATPNIMQSISDRILLDLARSREASSLSRKQGPHIFNIAFRINWLLLEFLRDQGYQMKPEEALGKVITLTGTGTNAQALNTEQYVQQTWPLTGVTVLDALKDVLRQNVKGGARSIRREFTPQCGQNRLLIISI